MNSDNNTKLPPEPFAHMNTNPYWGIRSPLFTTAFFSTTILVGLWMIGGGLLRRFPFGPGIHWTPLIIGVAFAMMGSYGVYIGIRRWRWKREYERVMGRSPW